jgi:hypothetical protein
VDILTTRLEERDRVIQDLKKQVLESNKSQERVTLTAITRPATSTRNTIRNLQINNLQPLTDDIMRDALPNLTSDHVRAGAPGFARYALEFPLKDRVIVADAARKKLAWMDPGGNVVTDMEGHELTRRFFAIVKDPSIKKIKDLMTEVRDRHDHAIDEDDDEEIKICDELMCRLDDLRREIRQASAGEPTDLKSGFVKEICTNLGDVTQIVPGLQAALSAGIPMGGGDL